MKSRHIITLAAALLLTPAITHAQASCNTPENTQVRSQVEKDGWKIVTLEDLSDDDDGFAEFIQKHKDICPGIAAGHFRGPQQEFAVALLQADASGKRNEKLVLLTATKTVETLVPTQPVGDGPHVVWQVDAPAGAATASFDYEQIGAENDLFTWRNGRFEHVKTSE